MPEITFTGCAPIPLAHYLKALGILRILTEQKHDRMSGCWCDDQFKVITTLAQVDLVEFFCEEYRPTAIVAPWNGGSGFFPKDNTDALCAIESSNAPRLQGFRLGILAARTALAQFQLKAKPEGESKTFLLQSCRNRFPDAALDWLDAVFVLGQTSVLFPPLLGTGGNDGRLEFTNNFMQRILEVFDPDTGTPTERSERWLRAALFRDVAPGLATKAPIGQFFPGAAGGANSSSGFDASPAVNPWDYILMIEGTLLFAAASVKRMESADTGLLVYPFCVRQVGVGYASASDADEEDARCEMWMPLWNQPTTLAELKAVFSEGRAQVRGRPARNGVDFAEAAVSLGVDRGIAAFQRYGFQVRNGLAYFATPLDRLTVRHNIRVDLLADTEHWTDSLRRREAPASVSRVVSRLEERILDLCRDGSALRLRDTLLALGAAEKAVAYSFTWATESAFVGPLQGLREQWICEADDHSAEFRLARSLAGMHAKLGQEMFYFRQQLEPVVFRENREHCWVEWAKQPTNDVLWHDGRLVDALNAILARRILRVRQAGVQGWPDWSPYHASLDDITAFIERRIDEQLLADLIWGLSLVDWPKVTSNESGSDEALNRVPSSFYSLLRLCFRYAKGGKDAVPIVPAIHRLAMNGDGGRASELAVRRLRGSGFSPLINSLPVEGEVARRTAAALVFPVSNRSLQLLQRAILKPKEEQPYEPRFS
jgi:CRISPR-associated protein Csx17